MPHENCLQPKNLASLTNSRESAERFPCTIEVVSSETCAVNTEEQNGTDCAGRDIRDEEEQNRPALRTATKSVLSANFARISFHSEGDPGLVTGTVIVLPSPISQPDTAGARERISINHGGHNNRCGVFALLVEGKDLGNAVSTTTRMTPVRFGQIR